MKIAKSLKWMAVALVAALGFAGVANAQEYLFSVPITVSGYTGGSALADFPVLVRISENSPVDFSYSDCSSDGGDIFFVDADGNRLSHEVDTWNTDGESCIWVKLPALAQGTTFEMRYGGTPSAGNTPSEVWSNYIGVWHMSESSGNVLDSTGHGLHGVPTEPVENYTPVRECIVGSARNFGANESVKVPDYHNTYGGSNVFSASGWFYFQDVTTVTSYSIFNKKTTDGAAWNSAKGWYIEVLNNFTKLSYNVGGTTAKGNLTVPAVNKYWNFLYLVSDGSVVSLYNNGELLGTISKAIPPSSCSLGFMLKGGCGDEFRMSGAAASADYIKADYAAQTDTLLTIGHAKQIYKPRFEPASISVNYLGASLSTVYTQFGMGASASTLTLSYGLPGGGMSEEIVVSSDAAIGETITANITGLKAGTTYNYVLTAVNNATPAQEFTREGSFTTLVHGAPECEVKVRNYAAQSVISILIKTPGNGADDCDVYVALGTDGANLGAETKQAEGIGFSDICSIAIENPTPDVVQYYTVRVVNNNGCESTFSGSFNPGIKWYFDAKNKRLTNAVGWKIACEKTTINGIEGYNLFGADAIKAHPTDADGNTLKELDLTGAIDTDLQIISLGGYLFRGKGLTKLHLPDSLMKIAGYACDNTGTIVDFEPRVMPDLFSLGGRYCVPTALFNDQILRLPCPELQTYSGWAWHAVGAKTVYFGEGLSHFASYCIDSTGVVDFYLTGDQVPTTGGSWHRGSNIIRVNIPIYSDEWKAYVEASAADPTEAQLTTYASYYPDGRELWKVGKSSQTPDYSGLYLCKWAPDEFVRNAVHVRGTIPAGEVYPAYGKNKYMPRSIDCSAPAEATYEGVDYICAGYVLEQLGDDGWLAPVTNLNSIAFTLDRDKESSYRITWLWRVKGYAIDMIQPESGTVGSVTYSPEVPESGSFAPDTEVTLTATIGEGYTGEFSHWEGDVPEENRYDNPLTVTMDQARTLHPVFATEWRAVEGYETTRITDGYWILKINTLDSGIEIAFDCMSGITQPYPIGMMDLRKPFADGRDIVSVADYAFRINSAKLFSHLRLPDTMTEIKSFAFQEQPLVSVEPAFPESVVAIGGQAFNGMPYAGDVYLMNPNFTVVNFQQYGGNCKVHSFYYGVGLEKFCSYGIRNWSNAGDNTIYLTGPGVPATESDWRSGWKSAVRICVPIYSDAWKEYVEVSAADPTAAQLTAYAARYTDGVELWKVGKSGQTPGYSGQYICKWAPEQYCVNALHVEGTFSVGAVEPAYGVHENVASSIECSAPAAAETDGIRYVCNGYVLEKLGTDGWEEAVTNTTSTAFTLVREEGATYRVKWLWAIEGYQVSVILPESGTVSDVEFTPAVPASGFYAPGTALTLAPSIGAGWNGEFSHWEGDISEAQMYDNPLTVTVNSPLSLHPVFATEWKAVEGYETSRITDGYWTLAVTTSGDEIALGSTPMKNMPHPHPIEMLDMRKPVEDGRKIVSIDQYAFSYEWGADHCPVLYMLRLPETLHTLSYMALCKQPLRLLEPLFPDSLINIASAVFSGDKFTFTDPVRLMGRGFTTCPSGLFGWLVPMPVIELGRDVTVLSDRAFYSSLSTATKLDLIFYGDVPEFGNEVVGKKNTGVVRCFFPEARHGLHTDWDEFCATNVTALTESELTAYYTSFGEDAPAPAGWWTPAGCNKQYVIRFKSKYDVNNGTLLLIK